MRSPVLILAVGLLLSCLGCRSERPLASLSVEPAVVQIDSNGHQDLALRLRPHHHPIYGGYPWIFAHLRDLDGQIVRTFDHQPSGWYVGEEIEYSLTLHGSDLISPLKPGSYRLVMGAHDPKWRERFLLDARNPIGRRAHEVVQVEILDSEDRFLELAFQGDWEAVEATGDLQVSSRRWWRDAVTIEVASSVVAAVDLHLQFFVLEPVGYEGTARLTVRGACIEDPIVVGGGRHALRLQLLPIPDGESCILSFNAALSIEEDGFPRPRSAALEAVSWRFLK